MKQKVKLVVTISVGPPGNRNTFDDIMDTVRSVVHYADPDRKIIIQDNSAPLSTGLKIKELVPEVEVTRAPRNFGIYGGLYKSESYALQYVYENYDFDVLLRMDSDALMVNPGIADAAIPVIAQHPNAGLLGNYLTGGEGIEWPREQLMRQTSVAGYVRDPKRCAMLRQLIYKAQKNGWELGQHILGGAVIMTPKYIEGVNKAGLLHRDELQRAKLQNDHTYSLLARALGLELVDFNLPNGPMAITWRGLPASPQDLVERGAMVVHATRFWGQMDEAQIRTFFRARREAVLST
ncbi:MAG: hypothetical protein KF726_22700 [Anaerolineae bacterium]|nr:hypothetical protein [Anaerolineae bacterium]